MRCSTYLRCLALGFLQTLSWAFPVYAQSGQVDDCYRVSPADPQSAAVVVDSLEFQEDAGLAPDMRVRLADEVKHRHFLISSATDRDWENELRDEIRGPLEEQGYWKAVVRFTSGLIRAEQHRFHYWVSVRTESGPQYHLGAVRFENTPMFSEGDLRAQVMMQQGDLFSVPQVREASRKLRRLYSKLGYIDFTAEPKADIDENTH